VEETLHRLGTALGCQGLDVFVSASTIGITTFSGDEFRTRIRRVGRTGVNFTIVSAVNRLSRRVERGELNQETVHSELERISRISSHYPRWLVVGAVGLACAAFSRLFGADWPAFGITLAAAAAAMFVRQELTKRHFNVYVMVAATAFVAGSIAGGAARFGWSGTPSLALAASVLLLVPGVPLINSAEDLISGHTITGLARGFFGALISLTIAVGLLLAIELTGGNGL
jgi:uncharacterized membrane protein YjjP (DUF1212 family)